MNFIRSRETLAFTLGVVACAMHDQMLDGTLTAYTIETSCDEMNDEPEDRALVRVSALKDDAVVRVIILDDLDNPAIYPLRTCKERMEARTYIYDFVRSKMDSRGTP